MMLKLMPNGLVKSFPQKQNGSLLLMEEKKTLFMFGATTIFQKKLLKPISGKVFFLIKAQNPMVISERLLSQCLNLTLMDYTICQEMYGSGVQTSIILTIIRK